MARSRLGCIARYGQMAETMPVQVGGRRAHVFAPNSCPVGVRLWRVLCTVASVVADVRMSGMGVVGTQGWVRQQWVRALVAGVYRGVGDGVGGGARWCVGDGVGRCVGDGVNRGVGDDVGDDVLVPFGAFLGVPLAQRARQCNGHGLHWRALDRHVTFWRRFGCELVQFWRRVGTLWLNF